MKSHNTLFYRFNNNIKLLSKIEMMYYVLGEIILLETSNL